MIASSSIDSTDDLGAFGPIGDRSPLLPLGDSLLVDAIAPGERRQAL